MRQLLLLQLLPAIAWIAVEAPIASAQPKAGPPPAMPTFQMRAPKPEGSRTSGQKDGAAQFSYHCGSCHLPWGMGTNLLTVQRLAAGETPDKGLLTNRTDLTADYVKTVVRSGKGAMPPLSRVEVTDAELASIATYLGKGK